MKTSFDRMKVNAPQGKRSARGSDVQDDSYSSTIQMIEKESYSGGSDGSRRRKSGREDHSWRVDYQEKRSNGWDSDWGPSPSGQTDDKYVPITINGEWIETAKPVLLSAMAIPPPPPLPLPPNNAREKELLKTLSTEDRRDYTKLVGLEHLTEEEPIPEWAMNLDAPPAPVVSEPPHPFVEPDPLIERKEFDGHAAIKKGHPCQLCREVMFFSGLA
eukprot:6491412-Amphidinium_carterae.2